MKNINAAAESIKTYRVSKKFPGSWPRKKRKRISKIHRRTFLNYLYNMRNIVLTEKQIELVSKSLIK